MEEEKDITGGNEKIRERETERINCKDRVEEKREDRERERKSE